MKKKIYYEYLVQTDYGNGFVGDHVEPTLKMIKFALDGLKEDYPEYPHRIIKRKVRKEKYLLMKLGNKFCDGMLDYDGNIKDISSPRDQSSTFMAKVTELLYLGRNEAVAEYIGHAFEHDSERAQECLMEIFKVVNKSPFTKYAFE